MLTALVQSAIAFVRSQTRLAYWSPRLIFAILALAGAHK